MAEYHLYFLRQGMLVGSTNIEADDDSDAARIAREQGDGQLVEVWNDHRRVRIVVPARWEQELPRESGRNAEAQSGAA